MSPQGLVPSRFSPLRECPNRSSRLLAPLELVETQQCRTVSSPVRSLVLETDLARMRGVVRWQREFPPLAIKLDGCDNTGICYCNRLAEYPVMCRQRRAPFPLLDLGHQHLGHCSCSVLRAGRDGSRVQKCTDSMRCTIIDTAAATAAEPLRAGSRT